MHELTVRVSEEELSFFLKLMEELSIEVVQGSAVSTEQQAEVFRRITLSEKNPDRLLDWEVVSDRFELG